MKARALQAGPRSAASENGKTELDFWSIKWKSRNRLDGEREFLCLFDKPQVSGLLLFRTCQEARAWRDERYGYIRQRDDLRAEPHGWRLPSVVRVRVIIVEACSRPLPNKRCP